MNYKDENGNWVPVPIKAGENVPVGTEIDYRGTEVPTGWEEIPDPIGNLTELNTENKSNLVSAVNEANLEIYSSEEKVIGKWIDGKLLYRKVFTGTTRNFTPQDLIFSEVLTPLNIDVVTNILGFIEQDANIKLPFNTGNTAGNYFTTVWYNTGYNVITANVGSSLMGKDYFLILEYTKTTDQGGN